MHGPHCSVDGIEQFCRPWRNIFATVARRRCEDEGAEEHAVHLDGGFGTERFTRVILVGRLVFDFVLFMVIALLVWCL